MHRAECGRAYGILLSIAAVLALTYFSYIERPNLEARQTLHRQIIEGTAPNPYRYRVLAPWVVNFLAEALSWAVPVLSRTLLAPEASETAGAFLLAYFIFDLVAIFTALSALFRLVSQWFSRDQALLGTMFAAATMPVTFRDHYFHPWSLLEIGLFCWGLLAIYQRRHWWLAAVTLLGAFNRETSVFIPLAFFFTTVELDWNRKSITMSRQNLLLTAAYFLLWLSVFTGLRYFLGHTAPIWTAQQSWRQNTDPRSAVKAIVLGSLFLGLFWIYAIFGYLHAPVFIRKAAFIIPFYAAVLFVFGLWYETRYLMSLYPLLIPMGLSYLYPGAREAAAPASPPPAG